jgi:hypothetical protein
VVEPYLNPLLSALSVFFTLFHIPRINPEKWHFHVAPMTGANRTICFLMAGRARLNPFSDG